MPFTYAFPHPAVATDIAIFTLRAGELCLLLIKRGAEPYRGQWALPGGFLNEKEDLDSCARRELREETGVEARALWHFANFSTPDRDPRERVISVAYLALLPFETLTLAADTDATDAQWFSIEALPPLAFDHAAIASAALASLRSRLVDISPLFALLPDRFTLTNLQAAYEAVTGAPAEKRNFRKMVLASGQLKETEDFQVGDHRPARLYRPHLD